MSKRRNVMANPASAPGAQRTEPFGEAKALSVVIQAKLEGVYGNG
jgi:hypothetical protein